MLGLLRFIFYAVQMRRSYYTAERAKDKESVFQFLRKARQAGRTALQIQSPLISQQVRSVVKKNLVAIHGLYQRGVIARIPEEDLELVSYALKTMKAWVAMGIASNVSQVATMVRPFEIAKKYLDADVEDVRMVHWDFTPLYNVMMSFCAGKITREETEKRLDECAEKLRKWLPELFLFPEESPPR